MISWCDHTWNPWIGCTKVSAGCQFCYAEELDKRRFSKTMDGGSVGSPMSHWGRNAPRHRTSLHNWNDPMRWNKKAGNVASAGLQSRRERVFCASLADILDGEVPVRYLADALKVIHAAKNLDWLLLTKRPENFFPRMSEVMVHWGIHGGGTTADWLMDWTREGKAPPNIWMGTSTEDQATFESRLPHLIKIPAHIRWLSCEPLLGPIDFKFDGSGVSAIQWVVLGGESREGKDRDKARPCNLEWIRSGIEQCKAAAVKCFVKQVGSVPIGPWPQAGNDGASGIVDLRKAGRLSAYGDLPPFKDAKGGKMKEWPEDIRLQEWPASPADSDPKFRLN